MVEKTKIVIDKEDVYLILEGINRTIFFHRLRGDTPEEIALII